MFPVALFRACGGRIRRVLIVALAALLLVGVTAIVPGAPGDTDARAAAWVGNSLKKHEVWDPAPATLDWVPGHPKGYAEGETAAFRVTVEADSGEQLMFHACLDYDDSGAYAFTGIDPWDTSYNGMTPPPAIADLTGQVAPGFDGAGLKVDSVTSLGEAGGLCPSNYLGWEITFTMTTTGTAYVVYGGHIAAPGDPLPGGGMVPTGQGAASASGVFQARVETEGGGDKTVNFSPDDITPLIPGIDIEKATNGVDADTPTGPMIPAGDTVTWTYLVTNTGQTDLTDISVTDSDIGPISCPVDTLAAGASTTCTATGTATAGQYTNEGTVTGTDPLGTTHTDTDPSHYYGVNSSIDIVKTGAFGLGDDGIANPGDTITYEFEVTNTGNVALTGIDVEDLDLGVNTVTCPSSDLAVGESMTCTAEYPVTQNDITAGSVENCALASGIDPIEGTVTDEDCFETVIEQSPDIEVEKSVEPGVIPVGEVTDVTWTIVVSNTGNVPLSDVAIADPLVTSCDVTIGDLAVGTSKTQTCTSAHTPDSLSWAFTNVAIATGVGPDGTTVTDDDDTTLAPIEVLGTAQLGDTVWLDTNKNGLQDSGEPGINGARVVLTDASGTVVGTATTAKGPWDGWYKFVGLDAGRYTATLDTTSVSGALTTAGAISVVLAEGQEFLLADFGVAETLPKTGMDSSILAWLGIALLVLGGLAIAATRTRRFGRE